MKTEILAFDNARILLEAAEKRLNAKVSRAIKRARTIPQLMALADKMPRGYNGARRIYEKAEHIEKALDSR
jgi:hypothetical protein